VHRSQTAPDLPPTRLRAEDRAQGFHMSLRASTIAAIDALKCEAWPLARGVPHWRGEARRFRGDARDRFTPSMRQRLDVAALYRRALDALPDKMDGQDSLPVPTVCPFATVEELFGEP